MKTKKIIEFSNKNSIFILKYAFKKYYYIIINLKFISNSKIIFIYANFKIEITFLNRIQRQKFFSNIKISKITSSIRIKRLDNVIHNIDKFITITIYANNELFDDILIIAKIIIKTHLIDNLKINMFINNNVLMSQVIKFDFINDKIIINVYQDFIIKNRDRYQKRF